MKHARKGNKQGNQVWCMTRFVAWWTPFVLIWGLFSSCSHVCGENIQINSNSQNLTMYRSLSKTGHMWSPSRGNGSSGSMAQARNSANNKRALRCLLGKTVVLNAQAGKWSWQFVTAWSVGRAAIIHEFLRDSRWRNQETAGLVWIWVRMELPPACGSLELLFIISKFVRVFSVSWGYTVQSLRVCLVLEPTGTEPLHSHFTYVWLTES
jgi:hypothetical protein